MSDQRIYNEIKEVRDKQQSQAEQLREHAVELKNQTQILSELKDLLRNSTAAITKLSESIGGIRENEKAIARLVAQVTTVNNSVNELRRHNQEVFREIHNRQDLMEAQLSTHITEMRPIKESRDAMRGDIRRNIISGISGSMFTALVFLIGYWFSNR